MDSETEQVVLDMCEDYAALENAQSHGCVIQRCGIEYPSMAPFGWEDVDKIDRVWPANRYRAVVRTQEQTVEYRAGMK